MDAASDTGADGTSHFCIQLANEAVVRWYHYRTRPRLTITCAKTLHDV